MPNYFLDTSERGLKFMDETDFYDLARRVTAELDKRSFLADCQQKVKDLVSSYEEYASKEAKDLKSLADGATIGPGEIIKTGNQYFKNVSGAWLDPFKAGPTNFLAGWEEQKGGVA